MQIIGIDVGGTNTDAALISEDRHVLKMVKTPTDHDNILASTESVLQEILAHNKDNQRVRLHLSTTLSTNAIIEGKGEPTAVLAIPGPGIDLNTLNFDFPIYMLKGYIDHRGRQVKGIYRQQVIEVAKKARADGAKSLAIVGKFSQRNNQLETAVQELVLGV